ncbi:MAG: hypothetical protein HYR88_17930 [Verrucomicrobia bacterium]|nr:hypothetical protein [Verrucomicrobiota bacterium]MBI3868807.1 hypothetical protein [Verrucomicrobiota bacterium]
MDQKAFVQRLYLNEGDAALAKKIADGTGESFSWLLSKIVSAGLKAIAEKGGRVELPLKLEVPHKETRTPKSKAA